MTKRLTFALVAVALFVLMAVMPVTAAPNGTQIDAGATIFIGEEGLNLTHALNAAILGGAYTSGMPIYNATPTNTRVGWWASAATVTTTAPTRIIDLNGRYTNFVVAPSDFVGYTGNWYLLTNDSTNAAELSFGGIPQAVFNAQDPTLDIKVWDFNQAADVSGKSVPQGERLGFRIDTNMYPATYATRNNTVYNYTYDFALSSELGTGTYYQPSGPNTGGAAVIAGTSGVNWSFPEQASNSKQYGIVIEYTYTGQVSPNIWRITNYTNLYKMTWADAANNTGYYGCGYTMYYNNSAPAWDQTLLTGAGGAATGYYSGKNVTFDARGLEGWQNETWPTATVMTDGMFWTCTAPAGMGPQIGDGFITLKVKDESGATFTALATNGAGSVPYTTNKSLLKNFVNVQPFYWGTTDENWVTDAADFNNQYAYPVGTYTILAESTLNKMKDNYKNAGADYTGKTVSQSYTVTLVSDTVKIEANKDSVVRSKPFSVTVTGKPSTRYYLWVKGISSMDGSYENVAPMVNLNQEKVYMDPTPGRWNLTTGTWVYDIGQYRYENGAGLTIRDDTTNANWATNTYNIYNGTRYYCLINTSTSGTRTVEFVTNNWTKAQKYTIRVENRFGGDTWKSDEVDVKVEKGAVTIVAAGDQSYYLGEEIKFSGTNTETYKTYLFIIGPNLKAKGSQIQNSNPRAFEVVNGNAATFKALDVAGDNTWSWKWGTSNYALDAGTYTIYAVSQPYDKDNLANAAYGTVSIIIKKPFVSATASQSTVAKGDRIYITGTAEGQPSAVQIWILGKNYAVVSTEAVNSDASFKYEVRQETTKSLYAGQYFVVVQHPMQNNQFDVYLRSATVGATGYGEVYNRMLNAGAGYQVGMGAQIFRVLGAGSLQGSDAAEALVEGINDANVDDTYTKLQFLIEEPVIRIDAVGDKRVGDKFTITAQTNLAVDDEILVQVYSSSFKPTQKSQSGEFSGATGTVKVTKGDSGMNKISFDVDSSTFKPDEYIVTEQAVIQDATGTALFNVLEGTAPTAAPTAVVTAAPTAAPTAAQTAAPTAAPTAVPTTKSPGYGALIALIGLGAVAFIVVRRH